MPSDAANLLIATIGKLPLKSYLKSWERFSRLTERGDEEALPGSKRLELKSLAREFGALPAGHTFQLGLTALIASAMSGSLQDFFREALDPDGIVGLGFVEVKFIGPYPRATIRIHKNNEKTSVGLSLDYSDISTEMADVIKWSDQGFEPDESGDLKQMMFISGKTIIGLGELLREGGSI